MLSNSVGPPDPGPTVSSTEEYGPFDRFLGRSGGRGVLNRFDALVVFGMYGLLLLVYFGPLTGFQHLLGAENSDLMVEWYWKRDFLGRALHEGGLPLINPYMMSGHPFLASNQSAVFYPLNWLFVFLPVIWLLNAQIILHFWGGLAAMHLLLRRAGQSVAGSMAGSLVFGFSGFAVMHWYHGHLPFVLEWPWTPLAVLAWLLVQHRLQFPSWSLRYAAGPVAVLALIMTLQFFAGHPQIAYFTVLILALLQFGWVVWSLRSGEARAGALRGTAAMALAGALTAAMAAVQLFPLLSFLPSSIRQHGVAVAERMVHSLPPAHAVLLVAPRAFGDSVTVPYLRPAMEMRDYHEVLVFVGAVALMLVLAGFVSPPRRLSPLQWTLAGIALFAGWLALGQYGGLYEFLLPYFPGLSSFRGAGRFGFVVTFALAWLAARGLDSLGGSGMPSGERHKPRPALLLLGGILAATVVAGFAIFSRGAASAAFQALIPSRPLSHPLGNVPSVYAEQVFGRFLSAMLLAAAFAGGTLLAITAILFRRLARFTPPALAGLVALELLVFAWPYRKSVAPASFSWPPAVRELLASEGGRFRISSGRSHVDWAQGTQVGVRHVWGADPLFREDYARALMTAQRMKVDGQFWPQLLTVFYTSPFTRALGMKWLLAPPTTSPGQSRWKVRLDQPGIRILEDAGAMPRGYTVPASRTLRPDEDPAVAVNSSDFHPTATVLLQEPAPPGAPSVDGGSSAELPPPGDVEILADEPEYFRARVTMRQAGWFVLMDNFLDGWTATVDNAPVHLYRANAVGRALPLPAGNHDVIMTYRQPGLLAGACISTLGWTMCLGALVWSRHKPRGEDDP